MSMRRRGRGRSRSSRVAPGARGDKRPLLWSSVRRARRLVSTGLPTATSAASPPRLDRLVRRRRPWEALLAEEMSRVHDVARRTGGSQGPPRAGHQANGGGDEAPSKGPPVVLGQVPLSRDCCATDSTGSWSTPLTSVTRSPTTTSWSWRGKTSVDEDRVALHAVVVGAVLSPRRAPTGPPATAFPCRHTCRSRPDSCRAGGRHSPRTPGALHLTNERAEPAAASARASPWCESWCESWCELLIFGSSGARGASCRATIVAGRGLVRH